MTAADRKEFEAWADKHEDLGGITHLDESGKRFAAKRTRVAWDAWQAARSSAPGAPDGWTLITSTLRAKVHQWHDRAVALGADGVEDVIRAAEIAKRRGEFRTVDGFVEDWKFPKPPAESEQAPAVATRDRLLAALERAAAAESELRAIKDSTAAKEPLATREGEPQRFMLDCNIDGMEQFTEFVLARDYDSRVHQLETICDRAGLVRENVQLKDVVRELSASNRMLRDSLSPQPEPTAAKERARRAYAPGGVRTPEFRQVLREINPNATEEDIDRAIDVADPPAATEPATPLAGQQNDPSDYGTLALLAFVEAIAKCEGGMLNGNVVSDKAKRAISRYYETRHLPTLAAAIKASEGTTKGES